MSNQSKSDQRADRRKAAKRKEQMRNMLWIGGGAILVAIALILPNIDVTPPGIVDYQMVDFSSIGAAHAPATVVALGAYQCSTCQAFHDLPATALLANYG